MIDDLTKEKIANERPITVREFNLEVTLKVGKTKYIKTYETIMAETITQAEDAMYELYDCVYSIEEVEE